MTWKDLVHFQLKWSLHEKKVLRELRRGQMLAQEYYRAISERAATLRQAKQQLQVRSGIGRTGLAQWHQSQCGHSRRHNR